MIWWHRVPICHAPEPPRRRSGGEQTTLDEPLVLRSMHCSRSIHTYNPERKKRHCGEFAAGTLSILQAPCPERREILTQVSYLQCDLYSVIWRLTPDTMVPKTEGSSGLCTSRPGSLLSQVNWRLASCRVATSARSNAVSRPYSPSRCAHNCRYPTARIDEWRRVSCGRARSVRTSSRKPCRDISARRIPIRRCSSARGSGTSANFTKRADVPAPSPRAPAT